MRKKRPKLGDIIAIPLPDGTYAFGRLYMDHDLLTPEPQTMILWFFPQKKQKIKKNVANSQKMVYNVVL